MGASITHSFREIDPALWRRTLAGECLDSRYYALLEETLSGQFAFRYAVLRNERTGAQAVQPFFLVNQAITAGLPARLRPENAPRFLSRLFHIRMAVAGCAVGEGRLDCAEPWALEELATVLEHAARAEGARIVLFKDFPADYRPLFSGLLRRGYHRVPSMPAVRLELDFASFEEYLHRKMGRRGRANLKRKLRASERIGRMEMEPVRDVTPWLDAIHSLYLQTYARSDYRFERLTPEYFSALGRRMPDRARFFLWRDGGRILAFALCMEHGGTLHYLNLGMDYPAALERHLYYVAWRDLVTWALQAGLRAIESGPLNYEAKFRLGFRLAPRDLYARHLTRAINPFFGWALRWLQPARHDPALGKFPNANAD